MQGEGKGECDLTCPKCHKLWARMKFRYDSKVKASDVSVLHRGRKKRLRDGDELKCYECGYSYTNADVYIAIAGSGISNA